MKGIITAFALMLFSISAIAQEQKVMDSDVNDYVIVKDEVVEGVRYVAATPSAKVCSKQIDIEIRDGIIQKVSIREGVKAMPRV